MAVKIIGNSMEMGQLNNFVLIQNEDGTWTFSNNVGITGILTITGSLVVTVDITTPIIYGGTAASGTLTLVSTSNATKGKILFGNSGYDEVNNRLGIGTNSPGVRLDVTNVSDVNSVKITGDSPRLDLYSSNANAADRNWMFRTNRTVFGDFVLMESTAKDGNPFSAGVVRFYIDNNGNVGLNSVTAFGTNAVGVLSIKNGTAPTTGPADTVQFYSSDDAAGHTIPSFYCEGTNVVATGQADIASSVRVKMRINGTVRTFLCV